MRTAADWPWLREPAKEMHVDDRMGRAANPPIAGALVKLYVCYGTFWTPRPGIVAWAKAHPAGGVGAAT